MVDLRDAPSDRSARPAAVAEELRLCAEAVAHLVWRSATGRRPQVGPLPSDRPEPTRLEPVILVPGLGSDRSSFALLDQMLRALGHPTFCLNYSGREADLPGCGRELDRQASRLLRWTGATQVQVVAHSLGGLVVRWAATHTQMRDRVGVAITLGTPHRGTPLASLAPSSLPMFGAAVRMLRPGLPDLPALVDGSGGGIRWVTVAGALDWIVPPAYALLPESARVSNVVLPRTGHLQLTRSAACHRLVAHELEANRFAGSPLLSA